MRVRPWPAASRSLHDGQELIESFQARCGSSSGSKYSSSNQPRKRLSAMTSRGWREGSVAGGLCRVLERTASRSRRTWAATTTWPVSLTINYAKEVLEAHLQASEVSQMRLMPGCAPLGSLSSRHRGRICLNRAGRQNRLLGCAGRQKSGEDRAQDARDRPILRAHASAMSQTPSLCVPQGFCADMCDHDRTRVINLAAYDP